MVGELLRNHEERADPQNALADERISPGGSVRISILLLQCEENPEETRVYVTERVSQIIECRKIREVGEGRLVYKKVDVPTFELKTIQMLEYAPNAL
jgi:hypothetical protein